MKIDHTTPPIGSRPRRFPSIRRILGNTSLRRRMLAFAATGTILVALVGGVALRGFSQIADADADLERWTTVHEHVVAAGNEERELILVVLESVLSGRGVLPETEAETAELLNDTSDSLRTELNALADVEVDPASATYLRQLWLDLDNHLEAATSLHRAAYADPAAAEAGLAEFEHATDVTIIQLDAMAARVHDQELIVNARVSEVRDSARTMILGFAIAAALAFLAIALLLARSIVLALRGLAATAEEITGGDLRARTRQTGSNEFGALGTSFNAMADELQQNFVRLEADAERDSFGSQLAEAFEMSDTEPEVHETIERSMTAIAGDAPMELLCSDSSKSHLERRAIHPLTGAPGCPVESPFSCVAVRRGNPVVFKTSESLNSCPKLRDRPGGPCSAVCVPVAFMGRALGVLHTTGPENQVLEPSQIAQLTTLATQAGARIGTVRSFERSQLQATTDSLTGFLNRRTFESEARAMLRDGEPFAIVMADIDHFKLLNDTYGHEAGDRALRRFAETVRSVVRDTDLVVRLGGEEFAVLYPGLGTVVAVEAVERLRAALVAAHPADAPTFTASYGITDSSIGSSLDEILRVADVAMYRAKEQGRDRIVVGDPADAVAADEVPATVRRPVNAIYAAAGSDDPMPIEAR